MEVPIGLRGEYFREYDLLTDPGERDAIAKLLREPQVLGNRLVHLISELETRQRYPDRFALTKSREVLEDKKKRIDALIDEFREPLNRQELFLYLGGSLLYGDPSDEPDYDIVAFSLRYSDEGKKLSRDMEFRLYELDLNVHIIDFVYVGMDRIVDASERINGHAFNGIHDVATRSSIHYTEHVISGYPLFVPEPYSDRTPRDVREYLVNDVFLKTPLLEAMCVVDLEKVLGFRDERNSGR